MKCIRYTQSVSIVFNLLHAKLFDCLQLSLVAVLLLNIGYLLASAVSLVNLGTLVQMRELETRNRFVAGWNQLLFVAFSLVFANYSFASVCYAKLRQHFVTLHLGLGVVKGLRSVAGAWTSCYSLSGYQSHRIVSSS